MIAATSVPDPTFAARSAWAKGWDVQACSRGIEKVHGAGVFQALEAMVALRAVSAQRLRLRPSWRYVRFLYSVDDR